MQGSSQLFKQAGNVVEGEEKAAPRCKDCGALAPRTETNFTLISSQHGWRLTFEKENGRRKAEWRCPRCWRAFKGPPNGPSGHPPR